MKKLQVSVKVYAGVIVLLAILAAVNVSLIQTSFLPSAPERQLPLPMYALTLVNSLFVLVVYGGLGFIGLKLAEKLNFADLWDANVSNGQRFVVPGIVGVVAGVLMIVGDRIFSQLHSLGPLPHPSFPASIPISLSAGIGEELIFRLFLIPFWVWLISHIMLKKRYTSQVFWGVAVFSALAFALAHIPTLLIILKLSSFADLPIALIWEIIVLNSLVALPAAFFLRKYGFLAAVSIHFWADVVWHVLWGAIQ